MRQKQWNLIDNLKRKIFIKNELKTLLLKNVIKNNLIKNIYKYYAIFNKTKIKKSSSIIKQNNRCIRTGRQWSINKLTRYSRFVFRKESYIGNLPGFKRASW